MLIRPQQTLPLARFFLFFFLLSLYISYNTSTVVLLAGLPVVASLAVHSSVFSGTKLNLTRMRQSYLVVLCNRNKRKGQVIWQLTIHKIICNCTWIMSFDMVYPVTRYKM